ncbi:ATP-dependent Clp protease proteolytic subunit [Proteiniclasticum sp. BAD-10]|uniref:ATP-dependent Clp protease proteolytic subunit n=1 Tax=Proteiniclasticum sediminis TaxID=2804028 RepID=A0A941CLT3_9CLOT|nr:NfeD family protein [Proteiniclasticum sediminis]MBR0574905.1 ATP-dependent Clp protease proteolytic subunit [Proteiniclasticum sediminis]
MTRVWKLMATLLLASSFALTPVMALDVWEVRFSGEVSPSQSLWLKEAYASAEKAGAEAVYLVLDTLGGRVDSALEMADTISSMDTIVLVNGRAISAGALLALSGSEMYMTEGSTLGGAEPQLGGVRADEKTVSVWAAALAAQAEKNGRDPQIARAMADESIAIPGVVEAGKLLTLTADEADKLGMTDGVYRSMIHFEQAKGFTVIGSSGKTTLNRVTDFLTSSGVSTILLMLGLAGLLIEFFTPGFGIPGILGLLCLGLYFGGGILAGVTGWEAVLLFLLGLVLLLIEIFLIPGFGITGITGLAAMFGSIFLSTPDPATAVKSLVIAMIGSIVLLVIVFRFTPGRRVFTRLILQHRGTTENGYIAVTPDLERHVGKIGVAKTTLRPSGTMTVEGEDIDVISAGEFIPAGTPIQVTKVEGMRVFVKIIEKELE